MSGVCALCVSKGSNGGSSSLEEAVPQSVWSLCFTLFES